MGALANPYESYRQQKIMTANPGELLIMLYEGCVKQMRLAERAMEKNDAAGANKSLQSAQNIMMELIMSLDFHYPIARELFCLYEFVLLELANVNAKKDASQIRPLIDMLLELKGAFEQVKTLWFQPPVLED